MEFDARLKKLEDMLGMNSSNNSKPPSTDNKLTKNREKKASKTRKKHGKSLFEFNLNLPKVDKYYTDGHFAYENVYGNKATQQKSKFTNIVENLNSQMRDKISYLVRKTKAHSKSFDWLNFRLSMFFTNLNLRNKFDY